MAEQEYRLVEGDEDWYVIPADKVDEFEAWDEAMTAEEHWEGEDFEKYALGGSPSMVVFTGYRLDHN